MSKKVILFYTDCFIFGGCEKPIFELICSDKFLHQYDYLLAYRGSFSYTNGACSAYPTFLQMKRRVVYFPDISTFMQRLKKITVNRYLYNIVEVSLKIIFRLFSPLIAIYELFVLYLLFLGEKADIVHINNGGYPGALSCRVAAIAAKLAGKKVVIFNINNSATKRKGILDFMIDFFVRKSVSIFVTGSSASKTALHQRRKFGIDRIINLYHGINTDTLFKNDLSLGEKKEGGYALMVARFEERKGHKNLVLAFEQLIREHPECASLKVVLIGDGPLLEEIKLFVVEKKLEKSISFLGHRTDYVGYLKSSLFLLNPSLGYEDLPYVILEAMALGIPSIGTSVAGIPEEIENGVSGIIVPPYDVAALAEAIRFMFLDKNKRERMGTAANERFNKFFSVDKMVNSYLALYSQSLAKG